MSKYLLIIVAIIIVCSACHKSNKNETTYTNDSVSLEIDLNKTTYREAKINAAYVNYITAKKYLQVDTAYVISLDVADSGYPKLNMSMRMVKMPDGSFRLDSTSYNSLAIYYTRGVPTTYSYPAGPVTLIHDGNDYLQGSFDGVIQSGSTSKQVKCTFRATIE